MSAALLVALLLSHAQGFHKKLVITLSRDHLDAVMTMDVDGGARCSLIRSGADADANGALSGDETLALKRRLVAMARRALKLSLSKATVELDVVETKLNLHEDGRVGEAGLSVAILFGATFPRQVHEGMKLEIEDTVPDGSPYQLEVFQAAGVDSHEVPSGVVRSVSVK